MSTILTPDQLKNEILLQLKQKLDHIDSRKDYMQSYGELIKDCDNKILYCAERVDYLVGQNAVQVNTVAADLMR
jgi:hypothetical protein